jgi:hypothetical protein
MYMISTLTPSSLTQSCAKKASIDLGRSVSSVLDEEEEVKGEGTSRMQIATEARPCCVGGDAIWRGGFDRM